MAFGGRPVFALIAAVVLSTCCFPAFAEEADFAEEDDLVKGDDFPTEEEEEKAVAEASPERGAKLLNDATELSDKLAQLKELLAARGEVDPGLKENLDKLSKSLDGLGLSQLSGGGETPESKNAVKELLGRCVGLAVKRAGPKKPSTTDALRSLATDGFTKQQAKGLEVVRLAAVCISDLTQDQFGELKSGKLMSLPKAMADKAGTSEGSESVLSIEDNFWAELQTIAKEVVAGFGEDVKAASGPGASGPSSMMGLLAFIPVIGAIAFMVKMFLNMQKEQEAKKDKKDKKKGKKQN